MFEETCKKSNIEHLKDYELTNKFPCCLEKLIFLEKFFESKNLTKYFSDYFFKFAKKKYKENLLSSSFLNENSELIFLNLLIKYSSVFYFIDKISHSKFLTKIAFKFHNFSLDNQNKENFKHKFFPIINNLACFYDREKNYNKALYTLDSIAAIDFENNNIDKAIYYNNKSTILMRSANIEKSYYYMIESLKFLENEMKIICIQAQNILDIQSILFLNVFSTDNKKRENLIKDLITKFEYYEILKNKINLFCFILHNFTFLSLKIKQEIYSNELFLCVIILSKILLDDYCINKIKLNDILKHFCDFSEANLLDYQIDLIKIIFKINSKELIFSILESQGKIIDFAYSEFANKTKQLKTYKTIKSSSKNNNKNSKYETEENLSDNSSSIGNMLEEINSNLNKKNKSKADKSNSHDSKNNSILNTRKISNRNLISKNKSDNKSNNSKISYYNDINNNNINKNSLNYAVNSSKKSSYSKEYLSEVNKTTNNEYSDKSLSKNSFKKMVSIKPKKIYKNESSINDDKQGNSQRKSTINSKSNSNQRENTTSNNNSLIHVLNTKHFVNEDEINPNFVFYQKKNTENFVELNDKKKQLYKRLSVSPSQDQLNDKNFQNQKTYNIQLEKQFNKNMNQTTKDKDSIYNQNEANYLISQKSIKIENEIKYGSKSYLRESSLSPITKKMSTKLSDVSDFICMNKNSNEFNLNQNNLNTSNTKDLDINNFNSLSSKHVQQSLKSKNLSHADNNKIIKKSETLLIAENFLDNYPNENAYNNKCFNNNYRKNYLNSESVNESKADLSRKNKDNLTDKIQKQVTQTESYNSSTPKNIGNQKITTKYINQESFNKNITRELLESNNETYSPIKNQLVKNDFENQSKINRNNASVKNSLVTNNLNSNNDLNNSLYNLNNASYINFTDLGNYKTLKGQVNNINDNSTNNSFLENLNAINQHQTKLFKSNNSIIAMDNIDENRFNDKKLDLSTKANNVNLPLILLDNNKKEDKVFNSFRKTDSYPLNINTADNASKNKNNKSFIDLNNSLTETQANNSMVKARLVFSPKTSNAYKPIIFKQIIKQPQNPLENIVIESYNNKSNISKQTPDLNNNNQLSNQMNLNETNKDTTNINSNDSNENIKEKKNLILTEKRSSRISNIYKNMLNSKKNFNSDSSAFRIKSTKRLEKINATGEAFQNNACDNDNKKESHPTLRKFSNFKHRGSVFVRDGKHLNSKTLNTRNLFNNMLKLNTLKNSSQNNSPHNYGNKASANNINYFGYNDKITSKSIFECVNNSNNNSMLSTINQRNDLSEYNIHHSNNFYDSEVSLNNDNSPNSKNPNDLSTIQINSQINNKDNDKSASNENSKMPKNVGNYNNNFKNNKASIDNVFKTTPNDNLNNTINSTNGNNIGFNFNIDKDNNRQFIDILGADESLSNIQSVNSNNSNTSQLSKGLDSSQSQNTSTNTIVNYNNTPKNINNNPSKNVGNTVGFSTFLNKNDFNDNPQSESEIWPNNEPNKFNTKISLKTNLEKLNQNQENRILDNEVNKKEKEILQHENNENVLSPNQELKETENLTIKKKAEINKKLLSVNEIIQINLNEEIKDNNNYREQQDINFNKTEMSKNQSNENYNEEYEKDTIDKNQLNQNFINNSTSLKSSFTKDLSDQSLNSSNSAALKIASAFTKALKTNKKRSKLKELFSIVNNQAAIYHGGENNELVKDILIKKFSNKIKHGHKDNIFNEYMSNIENSRHSNFAINGNLDNLESVANANKPELSNLLSDEGKTKFDILKKISLNPEKNKSLIVFIKNIVKGYEKAQYSFDDNKTQDIYEDNNIKNVNQAADIDNDKHNEEINEQTPKFLSKCGGDSQKKKLNKETYEIFNQYLKVLNLIDNLKVKEIDFKLLNDKDNFYKNSLKANFDIKNRLEFICLNFYKEYLLMTKSKKEEILEKKYSILRKDKKKYFKISIKIKLRNQDNITAANSSKYPQVEKSENNSKNKLAETQKNSSKETGNIVKELSDEENLELANLEIYMKNLLKSSNADNNDNINSFSSKEKEPMPSPKLSYLFKFDFFIELFEINYIGTLKNNNISNNNSNLNTKINISNNNNLSKSILSNFNSDTNTPTSNSYNSNQIKNNNANNEERNKNFSFKAISNSVLRFEDFINLSNKLDIFQTLPFNANLNYISSLDDFIQEFFIHHFSFNFDSDKNRYSLVLFPYRIGASEGRSFEFPFFGQKCTFDILINKLKSNNKDLYLYNLKRHSSFENSNINNNYNNCNNNTNSLFNNRTNIVGNSFNFIRENSPANSFVNSNSNHSINNNINVTNIHNNNINNANYKFVENTPKEKHSHNDFNKTNSSLLCGNNSNNNNINMSFFQSNLNYFANNQFNYKSNSLFMVIKEIGGQRSYIKFDMEIDDISFSKLFLDLNSNIKDFFGIEECLKNEKNEILIDSYFYKDKSLIREKGTIVNILLRTQEILKFLIKADFKKQNLKKESNNLNHNSKAEQNANLSSSGNNSEIDKDKQISFKEFLKHAENSLFKISINSNLRNIDLWRINKDCKEMKWYVDYSTIEKIHINKNYYAVNKSALLNTKDFLRIIGIDPLEINHFLSYLDTINMNYLLLNSLRMNNEINHPFEKSFIPGSFDLILISKRNIFFRITLTKSITFRQFCIIFPLHINFTEDITIDEIKEKLFDYYRLNDFEFENSSKNLHGENKIKAISNTNSKKKLIIKNLKILVNDLLVELNNEKNNFIFFGDVKRINKIFFNNEIYSD